MKELIEKLKKNKTVFGLMSSEERECFKKVGKKNCLCFHGGQWGGPNNSNDCFNYQFAYAIKPDYKPEPEFVDLEIERSDGWLGVSKWGDDAMFLPFEFTHLHCLPSLPNFEGFWHDYDKKMGRRYFCNITEAAPKISEGKKVYARFRGQGQ